MACRIAPSYCKHISQTANKKKQKKKKKKKKHYMQKEKGCARRCSEVKVVFQVRLKHEQT